MPCVLAHEANVHDTEILRLDKSVEETTKQQLIPMGLNG
jgi:hypothetical protein